MSTFKERVQAGELTTVAIAARELGRTVQQVGNYCRDGKIKAEYDRDARMWLIDYADLQRMADEFAAAQGLTRGEFSMAVARKAHKDHPYLPRVAGPYDDQDPAEAAEVAGPAADEPAGAGMLSIVGQGIALLVKTLPQITGDLTAIRGAVTAPDAPELVAWDLQVVRRSPEGAGMPSGQARRMYLTRSSVDQLVAALTEASLVDPNTSRDVGYSIHPQGDTDPAAWVALYPAPPSR